MGYAEWRNFTRVIDKAKTACETAGHPVSDHFVDINKMVSIGSGTEREIKDFMLTRFACYLIAQNGDPQKEAIAFALGCGRKVHYWTKIRLKTITYEYSFAQIWGFRPHSQNYFAVQTRRFEIIEQRINDWERLQARQKLTFSEKELSELIFERTGNEKNFGVIRSQGDQALFGFTTSQMKQKLGVKPGRPLADFLPTITIKAKDFATEITIFNVREKDIHQGDQITWEHITNNKSVRKLLLERGIRPEELPPEEDIKKLERRVKTEDKKFIEMPETLKR